MSRETRPEERIGRRSNQEQPRALEEEGEAADSRSFILKELYKDSSQVINQAYMGSRCSASKRDRSHSRTVSVSYHFRFCIEDVLEVVFKNKEEQPLIIIFHKLKGFDGIFILNSLYKAGRPMVRSLDETEQLTTWTKKVRQPIDIDNTRWVTPTLSSTHPSKNLKSTLDCPR